VEQKKDLKQINNGKYPVYYQHFKKESKDTVVFIHGLCSTSSIFQHFLHFINKNIILIELRGIAYSKCKKPFIKNYVKDLELILEKEKITGNVILVGYSLGCNIANNFTEGHSEMIKKVIMIAPVNKTLREIGKRNFIRNITDGLGQQVMQKWLRFIRKANKSPAARQFTRKTKVVILTGKKDFFFNPKDPCLKFSNIFVEHMEKLDHFVFLSTQKIQRLAKHLEFHLT
jgi:pimeloyl-ACP methyl ester carboxylesterase